MKKILALFIVLLPVIAYCQPDLEKIIKQENLIGNEWVNDFKRTHQWDLVATIMIGFDNGKIMIDSMNKRDYFYRFSADSLFSTQTARGTVTYFPRYRSFYVNPAPSEENQMLSLFSPFRVHYIDSSYVVVERIYHNFDVYTGRILTDEEAKILLKQTPDVKPGSKENKRTEQQRHFELWSRHS